MIIVYGASDNGCAIFLEGNDAAVPIKIHEQIMFYRKRRGMTQAELAASLGVSSQAVSKWETGRSCPDIQLLPQLAAIFGISADELLGGDR